MKKFIFLFSFLFVLTSTAIAQDPIIEPPQAEISDEFKAEMAKFLDNNGSEESYQSAIDQIFDMYAVQFAEVPKEYWDRIKKEMKEIGISELQELLVPVYAKHFTLEDLKAINAFYETPIGKKLGEKTPILTAESMQVGQTWGMQLANRILEKMEKEGY